MTVWQFWHGFTTMRTVFRNLTLNTYLPLGLDCRHPGSPYTRPTRPCADRSTIRSPLRTTLRREGSPPRIALLPALLSLSFCLSILVVFLAYANPLTATQTVYGSPRLGRTMGMAGMIVFPTVLLGSSLALVRRFELPPGALTLTFFIPGLVSVTTVEVYELLVAVLVTGIVADLFVTLAPPTPSRPRSLRLFGAFVPMSFAGTFFFVVATWYDLARVWSTTTWSGAIIVAGLSGVLVTYAIVPDGRHHHC